MSLMPDTDLTTNELEIPRKRYIERLSQLNDRTLSDGLGADELMNIMRDELRRINSLTHNMATVAKMIDSALKNVRENLPYFLDWKPQWVEGLIDSDYAIVVGADCTLVGPRDSPFVEPYAAINQFKQLRDFPGYLIATNKILERLLRYTTPDAVVILHTTEEIKEHFESESVKASLDSLDIIINTQVHPSVREIIQEYGMPERTYWFNSSFPDVFSENVDYVAHTLTGIDVVDSGGNVGIMGMQVAAWGGAKYIGLLGMSHSFMPDSKMSKEKALQYTWYWNPEEDQPFGITPLFAMYLDAIDAISRTMREQGKEIYNLTPFGYMYLTGNIPYMKIEEFVKRCQTE